MVRSDDCGTVVFFAEMSQKVVPSISRFFFARILPECKYGFLVDYIVRHCDATYQICVFSRIFSNSMVHMRNNHLHVWQAKYRIEERYRVHSPRYG